MWDLCVGNCVGRAVHVVGSYVGGAVFEKLIYGGCISFMSYVSDPFTEMFNMLLCGMFQRMCCRGFD